MPYISRQSVREEAGFQHVEENELPTGVIDGANKVFMLEHKSIVDSNYSDNTDYVADVTAFIDGTPVTVSAVDARNSVITLANAPASGVNLTVFYHHSQLSDTYIDGLIAEATSILHRCLRGHGISTPLDNTEGSIYRDYYPTAQMIVRLYAAGLALTRDYGSSADTEETSKDGYKKMKTASDELEKLCLAMVKDPTVPSSTGDGGNGGTLRVISKGTIFNDPLATLQDGEREGFAGRSTDSHEHFFRG